MNSKDLKIQLKKTLRTFLFDSHKGTLMTNKPTKILNFSLISLNRTNLIINNSLKKVKILSAKENNNEIKIKRNQHPKSHHKKSKRHSNTKENI